MSTPHTQTSKTQASGSIGFRLLLIALWASVVFLIDLSSRLGLTVGILYVPAVLYSLVVRRRDLTLAITAASILLIVVGWFMSPPAVQGFSEIYVTANRLVSMLVVGLTGWLVVAHLRVFVALEDRNQTLDDLQARLANQNRLLTIASSVGAMGGWELEVPSMELRWSDEVSRIHGLTPGSSPPSLAQALAFYHEDDRDLVGNSIDAAIQDQKPFDFEARLTTADGRAIWVRAAGQPVVASDGRLQRLEGTFVDITKRKLADDAQHISLLRFKQLAESMPLIVWTADAKGELNYVTQAFFDYAGYPGQDDASHWVNTLHPEDREPCLKAWEYSVSSGKPFQLQYRVRRHDGQYRWHQGRAVLMLDQGTGERNWYGSVVDVHDQKLAMEQAQALADRLQETLESITDALFTLDLEWRFTYLNTRAEQVLHRSRDELLGRNVWEEFAPAVGSAFDIEYHRAMKEQEPVVFEQFYPPLNTWFEVHAYPSPNGLAVYFQDITARRKADAQIRLLETAIAHLNDVVIITEAEPVSVPGPRIVYVNDAFERRTGYSRDEVIGKTPRILQGPETSRSELQRISDALSNWDPVRAELINYTKAGEPYWVELEIVPLANDKGWFTHWVAVERDVTERRQLFDRVQHLERMEAIGQLTGGVAHDFNNLLTVMLGNAELLSEELADKPALHGSAKLIVQAGLQGASLTKRLLAFARRQPLQPSATDVNQVVKGMEPLLRRTLGAQIHLEVAAGAGLWTALVDPAQLEDALLNLVINGRDAMPSEGRLTIETANVWIDDEYASKEADLAAGQYVMVAVSDTGVGISQQDQSRLFEPFFTTKPKGTGLGLPMVYGFLKQSGGHVAVYSELGQGTTVKMYLPRTQQKPEARLDTVPSAAAFKGGETILVVEDDPLVRRFATELLESLGYRVLVPENASHALEVLKTNPSIDLLFTDVIMPNDMGGRELVQKALEIKPDLKVLYTSGYTDNAIIHHGRLDPGVILLNKPYRRVDLARKIRAALGSRKREGK